MFANIFIKNRPFFSKMRNGNYQKAHAVFKKLQEISRQNPFQPKDMIRQLEEYIKQLEVTLQHASDAIRGLKRRKLGMYRVDKAFGVLEEEIVLTYFLEEMISSSQFLKKRLETDLKINIYRERLSRLQSHSPGGSGFLANILDSLDAMTQTEFIEIEKLIQIMEERYRIGDKLFDIILNKAPKAPLPT
ncbi:MAG: hypothetical protein JWP91_2974 [Fibrobacteres bacterium]|nr:hypothetical protein [Fibrobacterota bacterium]